MANQTVADAPERLRVHRENRKKNMGRHVAENQARAVAKFIRVPPRKARLVVDEVRGRYAMEALAFLRFIPNRAAGFISKVLASAVANAANNHGLNPNNLKLVEARIDEGPRLKRLQPRAQGRAFRILKRTSHITIIVQEVAPKPRKPKKPTQGRRAQAARAARQQAAPAPAAEPEAQKTAPVVAAAPAEATAPEGTNAIGAPTGAAPDVEPNATAENAGAVPGGPQTANPDDKTDEIGAPIKSDEPQS